MNFLHPCQNEQNLAHGNLLRGQRPAQPVVLTPRLAAGGGSGRDLLRPRSRRSHPAACSGLLTGGPRSRAASPPPPSPALTFRSIFPQGGQPSPCARPLRNQSPAKAATEELQEKATLTSPTISSPEEKSQRALARSERTPLTNLLTA